MENYFNIVTQKINISSSKPQRYKIEKDLKRDVLISYTSGSTGEPKGVVINQQAIHHIDAFNWIVGPVEKVCSLSANQLNKLEAEDTFISILKLDNGGLGTIEATTAARPEDFEASISIVGEKGMAEIVGIALNEIKKWKFVKPEDDDEKVFEKYSQKVPNGFGLSHISF